MIETTFVPNGTLDKDTWTDAAGCMRAGYYAFVFEKATVEFLEHVGVGDEYIEDTNCSTFALESHLIINNNKTTLTDVLCIGTYIIGFDHKKIHYLHPIRRAEGNDIVATLEQLSLHVDLSSRRSQPFPDKVIANLERAKTEQGRLPRALVRIQRMSHLRNSRTPLRSQARMQT